MEKENLKCECGKTLKTPKGLKIHRATCKTVLFKGSQEEDSPAQSNQSSVASIDKRLDTQIELTRKHLASQPKESFYIPLVGDEQEGEYESVQINGYTLQVQKGVMVKIPQQVAEMLANKYKVRMEAGREKRLDAGKMPEALS